MGKTVIKKSEEVIRKRQDLEGDVLINKKDIADEVKNKKKHKFMNIFFPILGVGLAAGGVAAGVVIYLKSKDKVHSINLTDSVKEGWTLSSSTLSAKRGDSVKFVVSKTKTDESNKIPSYITINDARYDLGKDTESEYSTTVKIPFNENMTVNFVLIDPSEPITTILIKFSSTTGGSVSFNTTSIKEGGTWKDCPRPTTIAETGYAFVGWFDSENQPVVDNTPMQDNMTIFAHFEHQGVTENTKIFTTIDGNKYEVDQTTISSEEEVQPKIKITPVVEGEGEVQEIERVNFNSPLTIGKDIISINNNFLKECSNFNSTIIFEEGSKITYIGESFLDGCKKFNNGGKPFAVPNTVRFISSSFMYDNQEFNQTLTLSNTLYAIGSDCLNNCYSFNVDLTIPATIKYVGTSFMYNCYNYTSTIIINNSEEMWDRDICTLATSNKDANCYKTGITVSGACATEFKTKFVNSDINQFRKLK